jgi:hypothetical protein
MVVDGGESEGAYDNSLLGILCTYDEIINVHSSVGESNNSFPNRLKVPL